MQPQNHLPTQQPAFASWMLVLLKEHYGWISAIIAALAPFAGIINLGVYAHYVGRADVFMPSLELGPGLILLWLAYILFFVILIGGMLITSLFLSWGLSGLRPKPEYAASIVRTLTVITAAAMLCVVIPVGVAAYQNKQASLWLMLLAFLPPALYSWLFIQRNIDKAELLTSDLKPWQMFLACAALIALVGLTALFGIYPAWFVTMFYEERGTMGGWLEALVFCFVAMVGSLAPAIGYYNLALKGRAAQIKAALGGVFIFMVVLTLMVPSLLSFPSVVAVKFLGISDRQVKRYLITNEDYPADDLDAKRWTITRSEEKKFLLEGFSLYAYGPIALLCPANLAKLKEKELDQHTAECIPFAKSAVKALDAVVQVEK